MRFSVITIFPEMIRQFCAHGLLEKALQKGLLEIDVHDLRTFAANKHRKVDDRPLGGGAGMVLMPQPLFDAIDRVRGTEPGRVVLFSAYGGPLTQRKVKELATWRHLILVCGRYEGVDQRVIDSRIDEEISLGEYVLMGGEVAAEATIEAVSRMIPGVVGNPDSVTGDSYYQDDQLAFPQYTQPREFRGLAVPEVLLSGHHREIEAWRRANMKKRRKADE